VILRAAERLELTELNLSEIPNQGNGFAGILLHNPSLHFLRKLNLTGTGISDGGVVALASASHLSSLLHLKLAECNISKEGFEALARAPHLRNLLALHAGFNSNTQAPLAALGPAADGTIPFPRLRELSLSFRNRPVPLKEAKVDPVALRAALAPAERAKLTHLDLQCWRLDPAGAEVLAELTHLTGLRTLCLGLCRIENRGAEILASAAHLSGLKYLDLSANQLGSEGIQALIFSPHLQGLTGLRLSGNPLTPGQRNVLNDRFGSAQ
jgi:Leucine-rich repeat (LRR) protein